jgi:hypothetical protein
MNERPPIRKPASGEPRSVLREPGKRHPVQVRSTFVRLTRQPPVIAAYG